MSVYDAAFVNSELSKPTSIFGLKLWVVIGIFVGAVIVLILFLISLCITASRRRTSKAKLLYSHPAAAELTPVVSKEIQEIVHHDAAPDHRPVAQAWFSDNLFVY
nr:probable serine/threonine-protein kinase At1g01540 [Ipomoea batatas]